MGENNMEKIDGIYIDINELKNIIIGKWESGELYRRFYDEGFRGEVLYSDILATLAGYVDDLEDESIRKAYERGVSYDYLRLYNLYPKSDTRSIGIVVSILLSRLWAEPIELVTTEDIPFILEFLDTPPGKTIEAWDKWEKYWANLDYPARRKKLLEDPKYN